MGFKIDETVPPMEREITYLLCDLCVKWGFCIPPIRAEELCKLRHFSAAGFAVSIVKAEGMNPESQSNWVRRIAGKFRERFGVDEISSSTFVDRVRGQKESW
jgi:hypothetical protein